MHLILWYALALAAPSEIIRATFPHDRVVLVALEPEAPLEQIVTLHARGWGDAPPEVSSVAHLYEHLWFRTRADGVEVWDALRGLGCAPNGHTSEHSTSYESTCLPGAWPAIVDLEVRRLRDPLAGLVPADIALEQAIVLREESERDGFYEHVLIPEIVRRIGANAGPELQVENVIRVSDGDLRAWVQSIQDTGSVVSFLGPVPPSEIIDRFTQQLGEAPKVETLPWDGVVFKTSTPQAAPPQARSGPVTLEAPVEEPAIVMAWRLPDTVATSSGEHTLFAATLSERFRIAVMGIDHVLWGRCSLEHEAQALFALCSATLRAEADREHALEAITKWWRIERMQLARGPGSVLRVGVQAELLDSLSPLDAWDIASGELRADDPWLSTRIQQGQTSLRASVQQVIASSWLAPEAAVQIVLEPRPPQDVSWVYLPDPGETAVPRTQAVLPPPPGVRPVKMEAKELAGGSRVLIIQDPRQPVTTVGLRLRGGLARWPAGLPPMDGAPTFDWTSGHQLHLSGTDITGESRIVVTRPNELSNALSMLVRDIPRWSPLPGEAPDNLVVDWFEDAYDVTDRDAVVRRIDRDPTWWADRITRARSVPHHPETNWYDRVYVDTSDPDAIRQFFAIGSAIHHPRNAVVVVVGPEPVARVLDQVGRAMDQWRLMAPVPSTYVTALEAPTASGKQARFVIDEPQTGVATVTLRCPIPARDPGMSRWADLLAPMIERAMFDDLRRTRSWAYTPYATVEHSESGSVVVKVEISTGPDLAGDVLSRLEDTLSELAATTSGIEDGWHAMLWQRFHTSEDPVDWVEALLRAPDHRLSLQDWFTAYREPGEPPAADAVRRAWASCAARNHSVVIGPASLIAQSMTKAGLQHEVVSIERLAKRAAERRGTE